MLALNRKNFCYPILVFCFYFFFCCVNEILLWNRPDVNLLSLHCKPVKTEAKLQNSWKPVRQRNISLRAFQRRPHSNNRRHSWRKANFYVHITNINDETLYLGSLKALRQLVWRLLLRQKKNALDWKTCSISMFSEIFSQIYTCFSSII